MRLIALTGLVVLITGCSWHEPSRVEADFGKSVRQMIDEQIESPERAARPARRGPNRLDGATAVHSVDRYEASGSTTRRVNAGGASGAAQ